MPERAGCALLMGILVAGAVGAQPATAQVDGQYGQVVSGNPLGLLFDFFNAEFERALTPSSTIGVVGYLWPVENQDDVGDAVESTYFNADLFARYYLGGTHFDGWNVGVKVGATTLPSGTYPGLGLEASRSWLLGEKNNMYVALGFGLKRLLGDIAAGEPGIVPTVRIVNLGFAF